ncbi:hypothetical protein F4678DRAFT_478649 [Xylaria arbuscula]|nr:hypothetical protein F4678DRAFT_478649 [Xylaria arbuscula]
MSSYHGGDSTPSPSIDTARGHDNITQSTLETLGSKQSLSPRREASTNLWQSAWLDKITLVCFTSLFTASWVALLVLWRYSIDHNGFSLTISSNHYSWTYGPTAVLTIFASLWRQVDYHCKVGQPWKTMQNHATDASKSLLLDYIPPFQPKTLYIATKNRHWAVAASAFGSIILTLVTVNISTKFNETSFWDYVQPLDNNAAEENGSPYTVVTPAPLFAYQGVLENHIQNPPGTIDEKAFQSVAVPTANQNVTSVTTSVMVFLPNISCEVPSTTPQEDGNWGTIRTPTCFASEFGISLGGAKNSWSYSLTPIDCSGNQNQTSVSTTIGRAHNRRLAVLLQPEYPPNGSYEASGTICQVDYYLRHADLTQDLLRGNLSLNLSGNEEDVFKFGNLTGVELGESIFALMSSYGSNANWGDLLFNALGDPLPNDKSLMDSETLISPVEKVLGGLMSHMIQQFSLTSTSIPSTGTALVSEARLHVQQLPLWIMISAFVVLSVLPLVIFLFSVGRTVPRDPTSVAAHAAILSSSPILRSLLRDTGTLRTSELEKWLDGHLFKAAIDQLGSFYIKPIGSVPLFHKMRRGREATSHIGTVPPLRPHDLRSKNGSWQPGLARYPYLTLILAFPIFVIGSLEALYQVSERRQGLGIENKDTRAVAVFFTSVVTTIIASILNSVNFVFASFAPFNALCRRAKSYPHSMLINLVGKMPLPAVYHAARIRQTGAIFSSLAAFIGSVLTVIASGLWINQSFEMSAGYMTSSTSIWNLNWTNATLDDGGAARTLQVLTFQGDDQPLGTWGDLVFPTMNNTNSTSAGDQYQLTVLLPALRPQLDCEPIPLVQKNRTIVQLATEGNLLFFDPSGIELPRHCVSYTDRLEGIGETPGVYGSFYQLVSDARSNERVSHDGCPSVAIVFGEILQSQPPRNNFTILSCRQRIQKVETLVTFNYRPENRGLIGAANIVKNPIVHEHTAENLINSMDGTDSFYYDFTGGLRALSAFYSQIPGPVSGLDNIFNATLSVSNITTFEGLSELNSIDTLKNTINNFYKKYMVLVMNSYIFRQPAERGDLALSNNKFNGTVTYEVSRLTVDFKSKLTLQIMLGVLWILTLLAFWLDSPRGLLPRNPFSIASVMALLADSRICNEDEPLATQWSSDHDLALLFEHYDVKLGWWKKNDGDQGDDQTSWFGINTGKPVSLGFHVNEKK